MSESTFGRCHQGTKPWTVQNFTKLGLMQKEGLEHSEDVQV